MGSPEIAASTDDATAVWHTGCSSTWHLPLLEDSMSAQTRSSVVTAAKAWFIGAATLAGSGALAFGLGLVVEAGATWLGVPLA